MLGLLKFTKQNESLFLLDEPDTHLNRAWKLDYLPLLTKVVGESDNRQLIIATHDPLVIGCANGGRILSAFGKSPARLVGARKDSRSTNPHPALAAMGHRQTASIRIPFYPMSTIAFVAVCVIFTSQGQATSSPADERAALLAGVHAIAAPGVPGPLLVYGEKAFVVATGQFGDKNIQAPVVAAASLGDGRVVIFGHTGYFDAGSLGVTDTGRLLSNAIRWSAAGRDAHPASSQGSAERLPLRVGIADNATLADALSRLGFASKSLPRRQLIKRLNEFDVICLNQAPLDDREMETVRGFVRSGHGLLMAGLGWGWLQLNPSKSLNDHPGNRLLSDAGLAWADGTLDRNAKQGFSVGDHETPNCHAVTALTTLEDQGRNSGGTSQPYVRQAAATVLLAVRTLSDGDSILMPRIRKLAAAHRSELTTSESKPLTADRHAMQRVLLAYELKQADQASLDHIKPHPAARNFPGPVGSDVPRVTRTIAVNTAVPEWHSTGLYAAPGETITLQVPEKSTSAGMAVRIGAHTDHLWEHAEWKRVPEVSRRFPLTDSKTRVANAFGGLIYIECPDRASGAVNVEIAGAVEAPHFVLGRTSLEDWKKTIRVRPAPWAELESDKIVVTVPSAAVRTLDDPQALMEFWDRIADAHATLATIPLERRRAERYVADVQISAGYMHSGYPIMTHLDAADDMTQLDRLRRGSWGLLHELGHNHQVADWTFDGTGEVTCNLFALHAIDTICRPPAGSRGHTAVDKPPSVAEYVKRGAKFNEWKRDPFLALQMYVQLQKAFGWDTFKKVFAEYRELSADQRPKTDADRRDQWLVRFSRTCGKNLGPFFEAWGIPTSASARSSIAELPSWMPDDFPVAPVPTRDAQSPTP